MVISAALGGECATVSPVEIRAVDSSVELGSGVDSIDEYVCKVAPGLLAELHACVGYRKRSRTAKSLDVFRSNSDIVKRQLVLQQKRPLFSNPTQERILPSQLALFGGDLDSLISEYGIDEAGSFLSASGEHSFLSKVLLSLSQGDKACKENTLQCDSKSSPDSAEAGKTWRDLPERLSNLRLGSRFGSCRVKGTSKPDARPRKPVSLPRLFARCSLQE